MEDTGLIQGWVLDGAGGARQVDWDGVRAWTPEDGVLWIHLDRGVQAASDWVRDESGLDPVTAGALLVAETRPREFAVSNGLVVILRGVNLNPGADPEDMVGLRILAEERRIVSVRLRRLMAVQDIVDLLERGQGPRGPGDFLAMIADRLVARMEPVVDGLGETADQIETTLSTDTPGVTRGKLRDLRHTAIVLRRYLTPQRDVMARLQLEPHEWLTQSAKLQLREVGDRITRYVEELEEVRERAALLQDELQNQLSETANQRMYILTVVAAVMLPLSFFTGLLGINVGGIPGVEDEDAFWLVTGALAVIGVALTGAFRLLRWV